MRPLCRRSARIMKRASLRPDRACPATGGLPPTVGQSPSAYCGAASQRQRDAVTYSRHLRSSPEGSLERRPHRDTSSPSLSCRWRWTECRQHLSVLRRLQYLGALYGGPTATTCEDSMGPWSLAAWLYVHGDSSWAAVAAAYDHGNPQTRAAIEEVVVDDFDRRTGLRP